jgi:hypothetical protein
MSKENDEIKKSKNLLDINKNMITFKMDDSSFFSFIKPEILSTKSVDIPNSIAKLYMKSSNHVNIPMSIEVLCDIDEIIDSQNNC